MSCPNSAPMTPKRTTAVVCFLFNSAKLDGLRTISSSSSSKSSGCAEINEKRINQFDFSPKTTPSAVYRKYKHLVLVAVLPARPICSAANCLRPIAAQSVRCACTMAKTGPNFRPIACALSCPCDPIRPAESVGPPLVFRCNDVASVWPSFPLVDAWNYVVLRENRGIPISMPLSVSANISTIDLSSYPTHRFYPATGNSGESTADSILVWSVPVAA